MMLDLEVPTQEQRLQERQPSVMLGRLDCNRSKVVTNCCNALWFSGSENLSL